MNLVFAPFVSRSIVRVLPEANPARPGGTESSLTLRGREMDSNHRFRAATSFVSRPRPTSPVAMILCVGNSDQAVRQSWINRQLTQSEISADQGMAKLSLAPHMPNMMANATN